MKEIIYKYRENPILFNLLYIDSFIHSSKCHCELKWLKIRYCIDKNVFWADLFDNFRILASYPLDIVRSNIKIEK